jgi:hypothetical protein
MKTLHKLIRSHLGNQVRTIQIGRSRRSAGFGTQTPVEIDFNSAAAPELRGLPYLKTNFRRGAFARTLYTPSTLHVTVGAVWLAEQAAKEVRS